jgi:hypothetical protein
MTERARDHLGRFGVWRGASQVTPELAVDLEQLGFGALWLGGSPGGDLQQVDELLDATTTLTVATGIVNIWQAEASVVAKSFRRIESRQPGRFLLGVGAGHPEATQEYERPYDKLARYVDALLGDGVPAQSLVLAALGPKVLRLAGERTARGRPARSWALCRCWRRSRKWCWTPTRNGPAPSAARGCASRTSDWSTTPATCAGWAGARRT